MFLAVLLHYGHPTRITPVAGRRRRARSERDPPTRLRRPWWRTRWAERAPKGAREAGAERRLFPALPRAGSSGQRDVRPRPISVSSPQRKTPDAGRPASSPTVLVPHTGGSRGDHPPLPEVLQSSTTKCGKEGHLPRRGSESVNGSVSSERLDNAWR